MWFVLLTLAFPQVESGRTLDELFNRLEPSTQTSIKHVAAEIDSERSLRIQFALLKEDLVWQNRGFTREQMALIAAAAFHKAISHAEERLKSLEEKKKEDEENAKKIEGQIATIEDFIKDAKVAIEKEIKEFRLGELSDQQLKFYY